MIFTNKKDMIDFYLKEGNHPCAAYYKDNQEFSILFPYQISYLNEKDKEEIEYFIHTWTDNKNFSFKELEKKQNMTDSFYMLTNEEKAEIRKNINKYTLNEIETKLSVICMKKKKRMIEKELKPIQYIVHLKDNFQMPYTTIDKEFCGSIEYTSSDCIHFRLNGSSALVIIPYDKIEWMAPSKVLWEHGYRKADK